MLPNPIITIGSIKIYMYGVMIAIGVFAAFAVLYTYGKKKKVNIKSIDFLYYLAIISVAVGFGFAALFHTVYRFIETGKFVFDGGITFLGGLIGGVLCAAIGFILFRKKFPTAFSDTVELIPVCVVLAHAFGRIGCFFAGCCYGIATDSWCGVKFPEFSTKVYPTQLFEAIFLFLLFALLSYLYLKKDSKHIVSIYLISYGVFRFLIEFIRADDRGKFIGSISPSQFWSLIMIALGVALIFLSKKIMSKFPKSPEVGAVPENNDTSKSAESNETAENSK